VTQPEVFFRRSQVGSRSWCPRCRRDLYPVRLSLQNQNAHAPLGLCGDTKHKCLCGLSGPIGVFCSYLSSTLASNEKIASPASGNRFPYLYVQLSGYVRPSGYRLRSLPDFQVIENKKGSSGRTGTYNSPVNSRISPFLLLFAASCLVVIGCDHFRSRGTFAGFFAMLM